MRYDLEPKYEVDKIFTGTTEIFLQIVSDAFYEEYKADAHENNITPF